MVMFLWGRLRSGIFLPRGLLVLTNIDLLQSIDDLERHYGAAGRESRNKVSNTLTPPMQRWLSHSVFFVLSSYSPDGIDCSPRGDRAGEAFIILDEYTIAIPDRRGNNRIDTLRNLISDPRVGVLFLVPGVDDAIRVKGRATISVNELLRQRFRTDRDDAPAAVILISVDTAYVQNARAIRRAELWSGKSHIDASELPSANVLTVSATRD